MSTLAEKRKNAIQLHVKQMENSLKQLQELAVAMQVVGLGEGAQTLSDQLAFMRSSLLGLKVSGSVN